LVFSRSQAAWTEVEIIRNAAIEGLVKVAVRLHQSATLLATQGSASPGGVATSVISKLVALKDIILVELCDLTSDATGLSLAAGSFPMNSRQNSPGSPDPYNTHPSGLNGGVTGRSGIHNSTDWFCSSNVIRCDVSRVLYEQSRSESGDSKTPFVFPVFAVNSMVSDPSCSGNECALVCSAIQTLSSSNAIDAVAESDLAKLAGPFMLSSLCLLEEASIVAVP
jgi:hypothetical protein